METRNNKIWKNLPLFYFDHQKNLPFRYSSTSISSKFDAQNGAEVDNLNRSLVLLESRDLLVFANSFHFHTSSHPEPHLSTLYLMVGAASPTAQTLTIRTLPIAIIQPRRPPPSVHILSVHVISNPIVGPHFVGGLPLPEPCLFWFNRFLILSGFVGK